MLQRVFVDADVLASRTPFQWLALLRDETGSFQLHSSAGALVDAARMWANRDPASRSAASRRRLELLTASLDEVIGEVDLERGVPGIGLADAAAGRAHVLVSARGRGGSDEQPFEVCSPDEFLCLLDDAAAADVRRVAAEQHLRTRHPSADQGRTAAALTDAGCPRFAARVSGHLRALAS